MTFAALFKAFDTVMTLRDAAKRFTGEASADAAVAQQPGAPQGLTGQIEARLTNVVVAALKEAFDRDHARLELERTHLEEERRRAEAALRMELQRQATDRELGHLRLLGGTALVGWIASVLVLGMRVATMSVPARSVLAVGWLLLLGALASAFATQSRITAYAPDGSKPLASSRVAAASLWLLIAGLALTALSLLL